MGEGDPTPLREGDLQSLYRTRFSSEERRKKAELWRTLHDAFFARYVPAEGTVLDLGAGYCELINAVRARRRIAVDRNPDTARSAAPGVEAYAVDLDRLAEVIAPGSVDLAFASNVFEHLPSPDALLRVLAAVRTVLAPRGRLIVLQPNVRFVGAAFWDFFDHTLPLTEKGMTEALTVAGFRVIEERPRFLPYSTKSRLPSWPVLVRLYLAMPPAQWVLGKQMFVVAERSA